MDLGRPAFAADLSDADFSDDDFLRQLPAHRGAARGVPSSLRPGGGQSPKRPRPRTTILLAEPEEAHLISQPEDDDLLNDMDKSYSPKKRSWSSTDVGASARLLGSRVDENIRNGVAESSNSRRMSLSNTDAWQRSANLLPTRNTISSSSHATFALNQHGQLPSGSLQNSVPGPFTSRPLNPDFRRQLRNAAYLAVGYGRVRRLQEVMRLVPDGAIPSASPINVSVDHALSSSAISPKSGNDTGDPFNTAIEEIRKSNPLKACLDNGEGPSVLFVYHRQSPSCATFSPACTVSDYALPHSKRLEPDGAANHNRRSTHVQRSRPKSHDSLQQNFSWPQGKLPVEIYELIAEHLSRDDIQNMRLVNREFEQHISGVLFSTVVVPFNTEIYGMLNLTRQARRDRKGKQKAVDDDYADPSNSLGDLKWPNVKENQLYTGHGIDVFRGFGPHIRKYGMSFDVSEDALANPPPKVTQEEHASFWGSYEWPFQQYRRFADRAGLEHTADETPTMTSAFSYLSAVKELALSLDSGLGWLQGPDISLRQFVFKELPTVFGESRSASETKLKALGFWNWLKKVYRRSGFSAQELKYATLWRHGKRVDPINGRYGKRGDAFNDKATYTDDELQPDSAESKSIAMCIERLTTSAPGMPMSPYVISDAMTEDVLGKPEPSGILYTMPAKSNAEIGQGSNSKIVPNSLSKAQKEWLLETEWAQRAFLMSYMLSVVDNKAAFGSVASLNIARLSSRYLPLMCHEDFWEALPMLSSVTLKVIPDWRTVVKDDSGLVDAPRIDPSDAMSPFRKLLMEMIAPRQSVKDLHLGWASGGERAGGVYARNKHLLPAPLVDKGQLFLTTPYFKPLLLLPHVEHLTFSNCWMTPHILLAFVNLHKNCALTRLTLDSVSLTADTSVPGAQHLGPAGVANNGALPSVLAVAGNQNNQAWNAVAPAVQAAIANGNHGLPPHITPAQLHTALQIWNHFHPPNQGQAHQHNWNHAMFTPGTQNAHGPAVQQLQAAWHNQAHAQANAHHATPAAGPTGPSRPNTWASVIKQILSGMGPADEQLADPNEPADDSATLAPASSPLKQVIFQSCGYVKLMLPSTRFDQTCFTPPVPIPGKNDPYFEKRRAALAVSMMGKTDSLLGTIVQWIDEGERYQLQNVLSMRDCAGDVWSQYEWDCARNRDGESRDRRDKERTGWTAFEREAVEFDGCARGGTGRFSGSIPTVEGSRRRGRRSN